MPILYLNLDRQKSLEKEPYVSFFKKFNFIKDSLHGERIELRVGGAEGSFCNGFYVDDVFYINPALSLEFSQVPKSKDYPESMLVRLCYSFEGEDGYDLDFHLQRIRDIRKRAEYFYIPWATHFEFSSQIDEDYRLIFDVLVEDSDRIADVCCSLISHVIAIFSLDN